MFMGLERGVLFCFFYFICNLWVDVVDFTIVRCFDFCGENNADGCPQKTDCN